VRIAETATTTPVEHIRGQGNDRAGDSDGSSNRGMRATTAHRAFQRSHRKTSDRYYDTCNVPPDVRPLHQGSPYSVHFVAVKWRAAAE
jgi:hypothetical protein